MEGDINRVFAHRSAIKFKVDIHPVKKRTFLFELRIKVSSAPTNHKFKETGRV